MKKTLTILFLSASFFGFSQKFLPDDLRNATPQKRKEMINSLSPDQRKELLKHYRENFLVEDLNISEDKKQEFSNIYGRYQQEQKQIKEEFNSNFDPEKLSDAEARQKLEQSFITGQKLLDNRRKYANEMQGVMKPQQVLKMFRDEGRMRDKFRENSEKRPDGTNQNPGFRRNNSGFRGPVR